MAKPKHTSSTKLTRRLVRDYVRPHVGKLLLAVFLMAIVAATTATMAKLIEPILDEIFIARDLEKLNFIAFAVLGVFVLKGIATYGQAVLMSFVGQKIIATIQQQLFNHLVHADLAYFHSQQTGNLISRFTNDVNLLRNVVSQVLTSIGKDFLTVIFLIAVMFYQDWILSIATFFIFPLAIVPTARIGRKMRRVSADTQESMGSLTNFLNQIFHSIRYIKAYGMEPYEQKQADKVISRVFKMMFKTARVKSLSHPIMEALGGVAIVVVILYGGLQVIEGAKTTGAFFSFLTALLLAYEPVKKLSRLNIDLQEGLAAAQRVFQTLDIKPKIKNAKNAKDLKLKNGEISFTNVSFSYEENIPVLSNINLTVPAGKTAALVGPSGGGKSTLLNLIPRFYDAEKGKITIDSQDLKKLTLESLRHEIALVSQEVVLFDDTVRANIAYGRIEASEDEIIEAAKNAAAHKFIMSLPKGYDTRIGEHGVKLSGGQRQRLAIARAMLKNAPILLLDEATSALDTKSEREVQAALQKLMQGRTVLVIAHRLSTIQSADIIYVIDKGKVIEFGQHKELLKKSGTYARLHQLQFHDHAEQEAS